MEKEQTVEEKRRAFDIIADLVYILFEKDDEAAQFYIDEMYNDLTERGAFEDVV